MKHDLVPVSYLTCDVPISGWFKHGIPAYDNNFAMAKYKGNVPDHDKLLAELTNMQKEYRKAGLNILTMPFSPYLEVEGCHDGIFVTDPGVSTLDKDGNTQAFVANFSETDRVPEASVFLSIMNKLGIRTEVLPEEARLEGGEVHYTPNDHYYFGGLDRANRAGHQYVIDRSTVEDAVLIKSSGFHLDTVLCPALDTRGKTVAVLACNDALEEEGREALKEFTSRNHIELLSIDGCDSIGSEVDGEFMDGSYASNCLSVPGKLIGPAPFSTPDIKEKLRQLGIEHIITPLTQCAKSGGGNHCLTHQLPGLDAQSTEEVFKEFYREQADLALDIFSEINETHKRIQHVLQQHLKTGFRDAGTHSMRLTQRASIVQLQS